METHIPLHMSEPATQGSYMIAELLMNLVQWLLKLIGMEQSHTLFIWLYGAAVFGVSVVVGIAIKWIIVKILHTIGPHLKSDYYNSLVSRHFFTKFCRIVPPLVFLILIQFTLTGRESLASWLSRISWIYIILLVCNSINTMASAVWEQINMRANKRKLPLNGVVQLIKMIVWLIGTIIIIAILVNKSPASLLAGLGAFAAVLMLVFKDTILGVVAGVQLAENDSLHVGDWIVPNGSSANGVVTEVSLTAIKIENWDKTISTVPPYHLVSNGFRNYRNMQQSNTREIQRSYMIDADSILPATDELLDRLSKIPLLTNWIAAKRSQSDGIDSEAMDVNRGLVDGTIETNLGIFRAYLKLWLDANPNIDHTSTCFVSTLAQTAAGIPLQVYCFTSTSAWVPYESIQSSIFEHVAAMLSTFDLYVFENPSGRDTVIDGYLSPGKNFNDVFGTPQPFFRNAPASTEQNNSAQTTAATTDQKS